MIKPAAMSLFAAIVLASCTSERQSDPPGDVAASNARPSQSAPSRSPTGPSMPAAAPPEVDAQTNDSVPRPADSEESSAPGGVLPLTPGVYVLAGAGCSAPANAGVRFYDGRGISGSATHACRALVRSRRENTYAVEQSCIDTPSGDGARRSESQTITVHDALTFTLATADESTRFRHCPMDQLPDYLRQRMSRDSAADGGN